LDPLLHEQYALENYKISGSANTTTPDIEIVKTKPIFNKKLDLSTVASLPDDHIAKIYVASRKIPESLHSQLYYTDDYKSFVDTFNVDKNIPANDVRLVIPFHDKEGNLTGFQGRTLTDSKIRYLTIKVADDSERIIYNLNRVDSTKKVYVFEGPIDSMFINNSIAVASSSLAVAGDILDKSNIVLVFDNEPRNKEIVRLMEDAIDNHFNVVIWPEMIQEKDINDMVLAGFAPDELEDILEKHTYLNLRAKMEFVAWKRT
jgi:hypothetical protein